MAPFITVSKFEYSGPYSYEYVEWAITHCRHLLVVCGSEVSSAAELSVRISRINLSFSAFHTFVVLEHIQRPANSTFQCTWP